MIQFLTGDMLQAKTEALVNTVNTVGVMGKGIALQFKEAFPHNYKVYADACKRHELAPGKLLAVWDNSMLLGKRLIFNFPTKTHWRKPSEYSYIEDGLVALRELISEQKVSSIALPPLGCGNGGLDWNIVKPLVEKHLGSLNSEIVVFEPNAHIKAILQKQATTKTAKLTPARAQLLYALFAYESMGEHSSLFAANKLAYFYQRLGQPLKLTFTAQHYGPYATGVEKVLYALNGVFLKGMEQGEVKAFEPLMLNYEKWHEVNDYIKNELSPEAKAINQKLLTLIDGFSSDLSLEILATTDFIIQNNPEFGIDEIMEKIKAWSKRKSELIKREYVEIALGHLRRHGGR
ncbi:MAG: macro domain-containing protein [Dyadobacter sp.]|uniref:type II toxin-antitoxin system antitoxin DNA ADP-ribosyl glycohydrolase DarG n=1 Tax=Dyadobacter sp. TaxID=1914288 RepID=UPI003264C94A